MLEKILLGYVAKQHGITEAAAAELLFENNSEEQGEKALKETALADLLTLDQKRVATIKEAVDTTASFEQGYQKAQKETLSKEEKRLGEKFGIKDKLKLTELVDAIVQKQVEAVSGETLDPEKIKAHPLYLALERDSQKTLETLSETHKTELEKLSSEYSKKEVWGKTSGKILEYFDALNPVLPKDAVLAGNQKRDFVNKFTQYDFETVEGQEDPLVMQNGKRVEDAHGNPVTLASLVANTTSKYYELAVQGDKGNAGNRSGGGSGGSVTVPANEQEYNEAFFNAKTEEERTALTAAYEAAQS